MNEKAVLLSIQSRWCGLIASGKKTIEVRKTRPKIETPFKVYIYCTNDKRNHFWTGKRYSYADERSHNAFDKDGNGKVIGEFICDEIRKYYPISNIDPINKPYGDDILASSCVSAEELNDFAWSGSGYGKLYGWHISAELKIYNKPKALSEFGALCDEDCPNCEFWKCDMVNQHERDMDCTNSSYPLRPLKRPPQSWCYVEVMGK